MPRLPGGGDVPRVSPRVQNDPGLRTQPLAFKSTTTSLTQELAPAVNALARAQNNIEERRSTIDRFRLRRQVKDKSQEVANGLLASGEVLSQAELNSLGEQLGKLQQEAITNHFGTDVSKEQLSEELAEVTSEIADSVGAENAKRSRTLINTEVGRELNKLTVDVGLDPRRFPDAVKEAERIIDSTASVLDQKSRDDRKTAVISQFTESIIDRRIGDGDIDQAIDMIENPRIQEMMDEKAISRVLKRISNFKRETVKGIPRDVFDKLSPQEQKRAVGALERGALVNINPGASELEKLDAKRVDRLASESEQATSDLREIDRMKAAIESGRFTTGVFSNTRVFLARLADFVGSDEETRKLIGDAATADTLDAAANRLAVQAAEKLGRVTNMSLQFIRDSLPGLVRTPEGNSILLEVMERASNRSIEISSISEDYIGRFGTLRPRNEKSFFQRVRDLEEENPVIDDQLRERIVDGGKASKGSLKELLGKGDVSTELPEDVVIPEGFEFVSIQGDQITVKKLSSGVVQHGPVSNLRKKKKK